MKISNLTECSTTAGAVATVAQPFETVQKRTPEKKLKGSNLLKGIKTSAKYANSLHEGEGFPHDVDHMPGQTVKHQDTNCTACHGRKVQYKLGDKLHADNKKGATKVRCQTCNGTGDKEHTDTEDGRNYANAFGTYRYDESVDEGAKVDRMVGHVKSSEKKLGKSSKEAENIAWATANKRGMLNNKNKKVAEGSSTTWEVSFDYGPHMSETVKVKAGSEEEAIAKVKKAAEKSGRNIMINWTKAATQGVAEGYGNEGREPMVGETCSIRNYNGYVVLQGLSGDKARVKFDNGRVETVSRMDLIPQREKVNSMWEGNKIGEGRFVKGHGGVPLDRSGNPIPPKAPVAPKAPYVRRDTNGLTRADYNTVWRKIEDVVGQIFPDGDPIDWLGPWLNRQGIKDYHVGEVLNKACRLNGFKDIYQYYDHFKTGDYGYGAPVAEEKEKTAAESDISTITDPELRHAIEKAKTHYGGIKDPITAFRKLTIRGLKHAEDADHRQDEKIKDFEQVINRMKQEIFSLRQQVTKPVSEGEITEDDVVLSADRRKPKSGLLSKPEPTTNPADVVKVDVPLLIRLLEFSKEDAVDDMALHDLAEKLVAGCQRGRTLTMKDYDSLVPAKQPEVPEPGMDESLLGGAAAAGIVANDDDFQVSYQRKMSE